MPTSPSETRQTVPDLHTTRAGLRSSKTNASFQMKAAIQIAESPANQHVFLKTMFDEARRDAAQPGVERLPLAGLAISTKDLFDLQGQTTAAGSSFLQGEPPALADCPAVARLKAAGGVVIGRTNMVEFAFSGVGVNPHFGTPANGGCPDAKQVPRIPGGSSSGAAVSVATGSSFIGLGSDTGGSIRIPAALNGIVGFKNTARLVPTQGAYPLSTTMDTVCALTRSVRDAILAHEVLSAQTVVRSNAPLASYRLAVARPLMQDGLDATVSRAWERSLSRLRAGGAVVQEIGLRALDDLPAINATGGFSPAEAYAWHYPLMEKHKASYDPRVLARIMRGAAMTAREYIELQRARRAWIAEVEAALAGFDAVLSPTVPIVAPPLAEVDAGAERDEAFFRVNGLLLRNTAVVNMLDGCGISIPCHQPGELPVGLMIWAPAMQDDVVLNIAAQIEHLLLI
jgi:aspartyl-tRNA(Asn)/glutamyl-tRNA(Gln) amidotransferase subunit A